jgi:hypothetical protein
LPQVLLTELDVLRHVVLDGVQDIIWQGHVVAWSIELILVQSR